MINESYVSSLTEKINNYKVDEDNKIKKSIANKLLSSDLKDLPYFRLINFFHDDYEAIDDEIAEKIINLKTFKDTDGYFMGGVNFSTNKKFLYAYIEKLILTKNDNECYKLLDKFFKDLFFTRNVDKKEKIETLNFIFSNLKKNNIKINIEHIFDFCAEKIKKNEFLDLIMNLIDLDSKQNVEDKIYYYFFLLINNQKEAEKFLVKNKIKKEEIIKNINKLNADHYGIIFRILNIAEDFFTNEKEFELFLNNNKDFFNRLSEYSKYHLMIEYMRFNDRKFYLTFVLFSLKNDHYKIRNDFDYLKYHVSKFFNLTTLIKDFNLLERQLHEYIKESFAKTDPETALGDLKVDIDFIRNMHRNREIVFTIRFLYPVMKDFFESDFFEKIIKKINAVTNTHAIVEKLNFLQNLSVSYGEKINKNDIPKNLIKIIDKNKFLKRDIESVID